MTGYNVEPVVASETEVDEALQRYYGKPRKPRRRPRGRPAPGRARSRSPARRSRTCRCSTRPATSRSSTSSRRSASRRWPSRARKRRSSSWCNVILMSAIQKGASDIHIEPYEKELRVRYRVDGILYNIMAPPMKFRDAITSRIKIMSKLDIAEKRLPQDGRIKIRFQDNGQQPRHRLPRVLPADALRREDRHASPRQGQADARHDEARLRAASR